MGLVLLQQVACTPIGPFVWLTDYRDSGPVPHRIAPGDRLSIQVWGSEKLNGKQLVRADGTVSLFLAGEVQLAGLTPVEATRKVEDLLAGALQKPTVVISIEESLANIVSVVGEIARPGSHSLVAADTILRAIAASGGLTEYARRDRIFVLRSEPAVQRIRVDYDELVRGADLRAGFRLRRGDVVVVE